ncbi:MAG: S-adenosylmethionine decarboxylase [Burkholderiales bacterium]
MKNLAPQIFRQRLLVEGYTTAAVDREMLEETMTGLAAHLGLRAYAAPVIFAPGDSARADNQGFDAFLPLADSGISLYYWASARFVSVLLVTCAQFDEAAAIAYLRRAFGIDGEIASASI